MSDAATSSNPAVYQLRVVLAGVSPLVWRRLLVPAETTIAELHAVLRAAFGWGGEHLHRFVIHGREYGISYLGGTGFRDDAWEMRLSGFGFRVGERFRYDYDFTDGWRHDLRVERILVAERGRVSPRCTGGRRAGPPEDRGGPWAFLDQTQRERGKPWEGTASRVEGCGGCGPGQRKDGAMPDDTALESAPPTVSHRGEGAA